MEHPLGLEPQERLAHRRAADPDRLGDLALADQPPLLVLAVEDALPGVLVGAIGG